jgi:DNA-binding transcriptional ArsR family regulator
MSADTDRTRTYPDGMETIRLADVAAALAEPSRATMCLAMLDGRAWTVGELARTAAVAPSTASEHVSKLMDAGFVAALHQGRHRYVRLADPRVAELIERLAEHAEHRPPRTLRGSVRARRLAVARTCYDHIAGRLGVLLREGMLHTGLLDRRTGLSLTPAGEERLTELGVTLPTDTHRPLLRDCLDWTERREHLGGAVPAALLDHALGRHWLERDGHRAIVVRDEAREPLVLLGVRVDELVAQP